MKKIGFLALLIILIMVAGCAKAGDIYTLEDGRVIGPNGEKYDVAIDKGWNKPMHKMKQIGFGDYVEKPTILIDEKDINRDILYERFSIWNDRLGCLAREDLEWPTLSVQDISRFEVEIDTDDKPIVREFTGNKNVQILVDSLKKQIDWNPYRAEGFATLKLFSEKMPNHYYEIPIYYHEESDRYFIFGTGELKGKIEMTDALLDLLELP